MIKFFEQLLAHLDKQGVRPEGTAACELGDQWVVVDYNCDGRLSYHRTVGSDGRYAVRAPLISVTVGGPAPDADTAADLQAMLVARWLPLGLPE